MNTHQSVGVAPQIGHDAIGRLETRGVDHIPLEERNSTPWNVFWIFIGQACAPGIIALGWLPVTFGLGWWGTVAALAVGLGLGSLVLGGVALLGPKTGTNSAVSSGAYFGVVGRLVGSALGWFGCLGFYALTVWAGGQLVVATSNRLFDTPSSPPAFIVGYALVASITLVVAVYGHASMVAAQKKVVVPLAGAIIAAGFFVLLPQFDASYTGGQYLLGSFWSTWTLAAATVAVNPVTIAPLVNDWTRRISPAEWSPLPIWTTAASGCFLGNMLGLGFGAYVATIFADLGSSFGAGIVAVSPLPYLILFTVFVGVAGSIGHGTLDLYSTGLDLSSIFPRLRRIQSTVVMSVIGVALVYLGALVWDIQGSATTFTVLLTVACSPWCAILIIGHITIRGRYDIDGLQAFNNRYAGGVYWFWRGVNVPAFLIWAVSSILGTLFTDTGLFRGPLSGLVDVNVSWVVAGLLAAILYSPVVAWSRKWRPLGAEGSASFDALGERSLQDVAPVADRGGSERQAPSAEE